MLLAGASSAVASSAVASSATAAQVEMSEASLIYATAFAVLLVAYLTAVSSKDLIRLLISLEMMFGAVFLALIPLFSLPAMQSTAFSILILTIFVSSSELLILIAAITIFDRRKRSIDVELVSEGGDKV